MLNYVVFTDLFKLITVKLEEALSIENSIKIFNWCTILNNYIAMHL